MPIQKYPTKTWLNNLKEVNDSIESLRKELVDFEKLDKIQESFEKQIYQMRKKQKSADTNSTNMLSKVGDIYKKLEKWSLKEDVDIDFKSVWKNFTLFTKLEDLESYKAEVTPAFEVCKQNTDKFILEVMAARRIVSRFDEVLLEKASKLSVDELRKEVKEKYTALNVRITEVGMNCHSTVINTSNKWYFRYLMNLRINMRKAKIR